LKLRLLLFTIVLGCFMSANASLVVYNASPTWIDASAFNGSTPTFVLPSTIPGCGSENGTTCEPTGIFYFNTPWAGLPSYLAINDSDGTTLSDLILFDSNGPGGVGRVLFYSDPSLSVDVSGYFLFDTFTEDSQGGFVSSPLSICCELSGLSVVIASDGESGFSPFIPDADSSDGIQFQGAVNGGSYAPEPSFGVLTGLAGAALLYFRRRKTAKN